MQNQRIHDRAREHIRRVTLLKTAVGLVLSAVVFALSGTSGTVWAEDDPEGSGVPGGDPAAVRLNEVGIDFGGGSEVLVEITSSADADVDVSGWVIEVFDEPTIIPDGTVLSPGEYLVFPAQVETEFPIGEEVVLFDEVPTLTGSGATIIDAVAFGTQGGAPVPPPVPGASLARSPDGSFGPPPFGNDAFFWTIDFSETFGNQNNGPQPQLGSQLLINEIQQGDFSQPDFVELYNPTGADIDVCGWFVTTAFGLDPICGNVPAFGVEAFQLNNALFSEALRLELFDTSQVRVAQKGIAGGPVFNECFGDCPDGSGPSAGWDFWTSGGDMEWFALPCTIGDFNDFLGQPCATSGIDPDFDPNEEEPEVVPSSWGNLKRTFKQ